MAGWDPSKVVDLTRKSVACNRSVALLPCRILHFNISTGKISLPTVKFLPWSWTHFIERSTPLGVDAAVLPIKKESSLQRFGKQMIRNRPRFWRHLSQWRDGGASKHVQIIEWHRLFEIAHQLQLASELDWLSLHWERTRLRSSPRSVRPFLSCW